MSDAVSASLMSRPMEGRNMELLILALCVVAGVLIARAIRVI